MLRQCRDSRNPLWRGYCLFKFKIDKSEKDVERLVLQERAYEKVRGLVEANKANLANRTNRGTTYILSYRVSSCCHADKLWTICSQIHVDRQKQPMHSSVEISLHRIIPSPFAGTNPEPNPECSRARACHDSSAALVFS